MITVDVDEAGSSFSAAAAVFRLFRRFFCCDFHVDDWSVGFGASDAFCVVGFPINRQKDFDVQRANQDGGEKCEGNAADAFL